jgi:hypothetical protein
LPFLLEFSYPSWKQVILFQKNETKLGQKNNGEDATRYINRWNIVDPRIVQNVDNIVMNMTNADGHVISLHQCGVSSRNELRNYVEVNNC